MINRNHLPEQIHLHKETIFFHNLSQYKEKLDLYHKAILERKITNFDQPTLTKLRKIYYASLTGLLSIFYEPTTFSNIGHKVELLTHVMQDKEYQVIHGDTDSTRNIHFFLYNIEHLDFNSWLEVKEGNKIWVYDLFSLLKIDKEVYYKLENPQIHQIIPKKTITTHPAREFDDYTIHHTGSDYTLISLIPEMEKQMPNHPFADLLLPEIQRYKEEIDFDKLVLDFSTELKRNLKL